MMTVKEVSRRTGVSVRTLQYYDRVGLLPPAAYTAAGYRLYDEASLERLQQILLFRSLEFSLEDIRAILKSPGFDRDKALRQQIELLQLKREHIDNLLTFARGLQAKGEHTMDFSVFNTGKQGEYARRAKEQWGSTDAYKDYEKKSAGRSGETEDALGAGLMTVFADLGKLREGEPGSPEAQVLIARLQSYITENYYPCTKEILLSLGRMYAAGGEFTENIDRAGGEGTAVFAEKAIAVFCR